MGGTRERERERRERGRREGGRGRKRERASESEPALGHFAAAHFQTPPVAMVTGAAEVCPRGWEAPPLQTHPPARPVASFQQPAGPGRAAAVRGGGGVPLPWQRCARRAHSSLGWERPGDTGRGVTGAAERGEREGQKEGGVSDQTNRGSRARGGEFGICPLLRSGPAPPPALRSSSTPPRPPNPVLGRDPRLPTRKAFRVLPGQALAS